jgi:hypothetical protein
MEYKSDSFKDYAYRGLDAFLKLTAKAGDSIRTASNQAIDKLDVYQLERNLAGLYVRLGKHMYNLIKTGTDVDVTDSDITLLIEEISKITEEIERRNSSAKSYE